MLAALDDEDYDYIQLLIEAGANIDYRMAGTSTYQGFTTLIFVPAKGQPDMVRM
ncbi:ankyrin repeat domain-containing protein [candidate division TA06 bacterium]|nr:ankyrin repeat domain-containing protein [candidate division TA06 bacterium]